MNMLTGWLAGWPMTTWEDKRKKDKKKIRGKRSQGETQGHGDKKN
jgi:hypothetical protein